MLTKVSVIIIIGSMADECYCVVWK